MSTSTITAISLLFTLVLPLTPASPSKLTLPTSYKQIKYCPFTCPPGLHCVHELCDCLCAAPKYCKCRLSAPDPCSKCPAWTVCTGKVGTNSRRCVRPSSAGESCRKVQCAPWLVCRDGICRHRKCPRCPHGLVCERPPYGCGILWKAPVNVKCNDSDEECGPGKECQEGVCKPIKEYD